MSKKKFPLFAFAALFVCPATIFAASPEGPGLGARANSMGGAFIGLADDWTAVYWNPAGLAKQEKIGLGATSDFVTSHIKDGNSIANPPIALKNADQGDPFGQLPAPYFAEPTKFNKTNVESHAVLPGLGAYVPLKGVTLAVSAYQSLGYKSEWEDTLNTGFGSINAQYKTNLSLRVANISLATKIHPSFALGAGVNLMNGEYDRYDRKNTVNNTVPALSYNMEKDLQTAGHSVEGIFGFLYQPNEQLSIGGVYRTGSQINLEGNYTIDNTPDSALLPDVASGVKRVFNQPATYGIGLAFKPQVNWTLTADWQRTEWDKVRTEIWYESAALPDTSTDAGWRNTERWRIGTEYKLCEDKIALRCGFYLDPAQIPNKSVSLSNLVEVNRKAVTAGIGYKGENYQLDLTYLYTWGSANIYGVDYEKIVNSWQLAASTWF